ncbi:MAG: hypothetical protein ACR2OH_10345, partial [Microthrixaceae bacterium]
PAGATQRALSGHSWPMDSEHAAKGSEHLQQAARELIGAARSFLDAAEELVEDSGFVDDAAAAIRTVAEDLGSLARRGGEAWPSADSDGADATGGNVADADEQRDSGRSTDHDSGSNATGGAESATAGGNDVTSTRVRRIDVE